MTRGMVLSLLLACVAVIPAACHELETPSAPAGNPAGHPSRTSMPTNPGRFVGLNINAGSIEAGRALQELNVDVARIGLYWYVYGYGADNDPGAVARDLDNLEAGAGHHIEILATVGYAFSNVESRFYRPTGPAWDYCGDRTDLRRELACVPKMIEGDPAWPDFLARWKTFVGKAVRQYASRITYWGAWNEPSNSPAPNDTSWFMGDATQFDILSKALCDTVHAVGAELGRGLTCVGPEIGLHQDDGEVGQLDLPWIQRSLADGFDIVSVHIYNASDRFYGLASRVKDVIGSRPLWVTETAHLSPNVAQPAHDPELHERGVYDKLSTWIPGGNPVDGLFYFDLYSNGAGLMNEALANKRPAYFAFKKIMASWRLGTPPYLPPPPGNCSTDAGFAPCPYGADIPQGYNGFVDVHVVDFNNQPIAGINVVGYRGLGAYGIKVTDQNGFATFRVQQYDGNGPLEHGVFVHELPSGVALPFALNPPKTLVPSYYDAIRTDATPVQRRTFVLSRGPLCRLTAHAIERSYGYPLWGVGFTAYTGFGVVGTQYTDGSGTTSFMVDCSRVYGLSTGESIWPEGVTYWTGETYAYCDDQIFTVNPVWGSAPDPTPYISKQRDCWFYFYAF